MVWITDRRVLSMIILSLWLTYSTYNNPGEKRKQRTKQINVYQLHNNSLACKDYFGLDPEDDGNIFLGNWGKYLSLNTSLFDTNTGSD